MYQNKRRFGIITLTSIIGFFLAMAPVLDPYVAIEIGRGFTLKINDIFMILFTIMCFNKTYKNKNKSGFLCIWLLGLGMISIIGNIASNTDIMNSLKNLTVWFVYAFCLMYLWKVPCRKEFLHWVEIIAAIASIIVILQFVCGYLGISMWNGRIPGLALGKYDGWAGYIDINTRDIRPNGIFQEASYLGIYVSIAYAQAFKEEKIKNMILYATAMLMTTSIISIIMLVTITILTMLMKKKINLSSKTTKKILFLTFVALLALILISSVNDAVSNSIAYITKRFSNFFSDLNGERMSSTKYRIIGHIDLYKNYSIIQKLFGVGIGQYSEYFGVKAYSNVWVTTILNCGLVGLIYLIICVLNMLKKIKKENIIYFVIFVLVLSSDWQWFSWYFFALISACTLVENIDADVVYH